MNYKQKYLKYKQKYLKVKAQIGAGDEEEKCIVKFNNDEDFEFNNYCVRYNKDTKKFIVSVITQFENKAASFDDEGNGELIAPLQQPIEYTKEEFSKVIEDDISFLSPKNIEILKKYIEDLN